MNYLDHAYDLNKLSNKFEDNYDVIKIVNELRNAIMNNEQDRLLDIVFKVFDLIDSDNECNCEFYDDELEEDYDDGYNKGYSDAVKEAISTLEDMI